MFRGFVYMFRSSSQSKRSWCRRLPQILPLLTEISPLDNPSITWALVVMPILLYSEDRQDMWRPSSSLVSLAISLR
jgi:hypothetical protein